MVDAWRAAWTVHTFLGCMLYTAGRRPRPRPAVNDVYLERWWSVRTDRDRRHTVVTDRLRGIIASTALGSTAYHFSASGHACHPE